MSMENSLHCHLIKGIWINGYHTKAMIDSGAQGNYISPNLVNRLRLPWKVKNEPYRLRTVEGEYVAYGQGYVNRETAPLTLTIGGKRHTLSLDITEISDKDVILGIPWLRASNPRVNWRTGHFQWDTPGSGSNEQERPKQAPFHDHGKEALRIYVMTKEPRADTIKEIPEEYSRYSKLFSDELETGLPAHNRWDHEITLKPGKEPPFCKTYPLNEKHRQALREYLDTNLKKGYIKPSQSPAGFPILFVPKKNGKLRLCVDYRKLNEITVKNRYPLPLISELRDRLHGACWFTALDLKGAYNLIRVKEGQEWMTAFRTTMGHFEYRVMPFGLTNAPATFQTMIDHILRRFDKFVVVYLDDILIFSPTLEEHKKHVHTVLQELEKQNLLVEADKCEFHTQKVIFLGYEISPGQIRMDPAKIQTIREWPAPTKVKEVQSFLGFCNFYRRFIKNYGGLAIPLTDLTKKETEFRWTETEQKAFDKLKQCMLTEPILLIPDPDKPFEVETDASEFALGGQLGQRDAEGRLHPVAFYSKKLHGPELNYGIHDKELMAIIEAFKEWKHYLSGTTHEVKVYTDHKNLTSFTTSKELNKRQIRWYEFLCEFNFEIIYRKGSENGRADALSRREDLRSEEPVHDTVLLRTNEAGHLTLGTKELSATWTVEPDQTWIRRIKSAYESDDYLKNKETNPRIVERQGVYLFNNAKYVPQKLQKELVNEFHAHQLNGHQGIAKTISRLRRTYDFPDLRKCVQEIIKDCDTCNKAKASRHAPYGELRPIEPPDKAWHTVAMDFIVKLPPSEEPMTEAIYDSILVITDKLTKYAYFLPYMESSTAKDLAYLFWRQVANQHGLPRKIITDRDKLFTSKFWKSLLQQVGMRQSMSTAFHPQSDGQTERLNQTLEQYLRSYVNYEQNNWVELLPSAQWAYNSSNNESMGMSPFKANFGLEPTVTHLESPKEDVQDATDLATRISTLHTNLQREWIFLQNRMAHYYNKKRLPAPILKEGDKVYLVRKNILTNRPSDKLDWKKIGPYRIDKKLSDVNYQIAFPQGTKIHPVFHVSLLEPAPETIPLETDNEVFTARGQALEYQVERIVGHRFDSRNGPKIEYLVKWEDYEDTDNTWEPQKHLEKECKEEISRYHELRKKQGTTQTTDGPITQYLLKEPAEPIPME